jgi:DNA-binding NarL/FixJ family response regulator
MISNPAGLDPTRSRSAVAVDPHPLWLDALERLFGGIGIAIAGKTTSLDEGLDLVERHRPDLVVTEIVGTRGEVEPFDFLVRVRRLAQEARLVVCSTSEDPDDVAKALAAGAVAYIVKTTHPHDLAFAVRQSFEHSIYLGSLASAARANHGPPETPSLTRREAQILGLVAEGHTNPQLARILWVTEQTVKFHLTNIYRKLGVATRSEATRWARTHGLAGSPPAEEGPLEGQGGIPA